MEISALMEMSPSRKCLPGFEVKAEGYSGDEKCGSRNSESRKRYKDKQRNNWHEYCHLRTESECTVPSEQ